MASVWPRKSFIFVDDSNVFIEGRKAVAVLRSSEVEGKRYRLDFGNLFRALTPPGGSSFFIEDGEHYPRLYGSEPPRLDSLWDRLEEMGVSVTIFKKNFFGKEKAVGTSIVSDGTDLVSHVGGSPDRELVLVGGDRDIVPLLAKAEKYNWHSRVVFWRHAAAKELRERRDFSDLTPLYERIGVFTRTPEMYPGFADDTDWSDVVGYHREDKAPRRRPWK